MDNIYIPPAYKTTNPPVDHLRSRPDFLHVTDEHRKRFFTNFNVELLSSIRRIKNNF